MEKESHLTSPVNRFERDSGFEKQDRVSKFFRNKITIALIGLFSLVSGCTTASSASKSTDPTRHAAGLARKNRQHNNPARREPVKTRPKDQKEQQDRSYRKEKYHDRPFSIDRCLLWKKCRRADLKDSPPNTC